MNEIPYLVKYLIIYLCVLIPVVILSKRFEFYDIPNNRKIHKKKIINTSGVSLYVYLVILNYNFELSYHIEQVISAGFLVLLCGFVDDRRNLTPSGKLFLLAIPTMYLIINGFQLNDLGNYEILGKIELGKFSFIFSILACFLLINSYNYLDGIDGLAIVNFLSAILYIIFLIQVKDEQNDYEVVKFLTLISIPLVLNLILNLLPTRSALKMFMGDSGSLLLGFLISFLMIYLYNFKNIHPSYLIWICWYPLYDFLSVTLFRLVNKREIFKPDNTHMHHIVIKYFENSHIKSTTLISILNILIISIGYLVTEFIGNIFSLLFFIIAFLMFYFIKVLFLNKHKNYFTKL